MADRLRPSSEEASREHAGGTALSRKRLVLLLCVVLALWTFLVFSRLLQAGFINYDDPVYVTENLRVQAGVTWQNMRWAFSTLYFGFYYPLTWLSHMLDCDLYGLWAGGHHLTSVLLHAGSAVVLLVVLFRMTGALWRSAFVAALFAVHPLHVESVAWISERKDVLSTLFLMLMLLFYARYAENPSPKRYITVVVLFLLGLMAKSMIVTAPVLLLLLDAWPLGRWAGGGAEVAGRERRSTLYLVLEKLPLFLVAGLFTLLTSISQAHIGAVTAVQAISLRIRAENGLLACGGYLVKFIWPTGLILPYPYRFRDLPSNLVALCALLLLGMAVLALFWLKRRPYVFVGLAWFIAGLFPVIGIIQVGSQASADRYTYVPLVGVFLAVTWGLTDWFAASKKARGVLAVIALASLAIVSGLTWIQTGYWKNSITLFEHTIAVMPDNDLGHSQLGVALMDAGRLDEAKEQLKIATRLAPDQKEAWGALGDIFLKQGKPEAAERCYEWILQIQPGNKKALNQMGLLFEKIGQREKAKAEFRECEEKNPDFLPPRLNLGRLLREEGDLAGAVAQYREAAELSPYSVDVHCLLANALAIQGRDDLAEPEYFKAITLDPSSGEAYVQLGLLRARKGRFDEARDEILKGLQRMPNNAEAHYQLAKVLLALQDKRGAANNLRVALRLKPGWPEAQRLLKTAESGVGGQ